MSSWIDQQRKEQARFRRKYQVMMAVYGAILITAAGGAVAFIVMR